MLRDSETGLNAMGHTDEAEMMARKCFVVEPFLEVGSELRDGERLVFGVKYNEIGIMFLQIDKDLVMKMGNVISV